MKHTRSTPAWAGLSFALTILAACATPGAVPVERYAFAPPSAAHATGEMIELAEENRAVSRWLSSLSRVERERRPLIIVPGYSPIDDTSIEALPDVTRARLALASAAYEEFDGLAILVTGGNVHPPTTPFNEAFGMKRHMIDDLNIPADRVVLEPYARHTTTNLRNAGRFMLAHEIESAIVVTTKLQSFYISHGLLSGFRARCLRELGYELGRLQRLSPTRTRFEPAPEVMRRGSDPLDP